MEIEKDLIRNLNKFIFFAKSVKLYFWRSEVYKHVQGIKYLLILFNLFFFIEFWRWEKIIRIESKSVSGEEKNWPRFLNKQD